MMRIVRMLLMQMQLKALTEREIYLDELKKEGNKENNKKSGFGGSAPNNKPSKPVEISDDDLPF